MLDSTPTPTGPDPLIEQLLEHLRTRFFGLYRGIVVANDDPSKLGRIKAKVPSVLGEVATGWCLPCVPYAGDQVGIAFLPEVDSGVWITFEGGDVSYPVWVGCFWRSGELPSSVQPGVKLIATKSPHALKLDDSGQAITLTDPNGNTVQLDSTGITHSKGGQHVVVSDSSVSVNDGALEVN
jgi:uncharacterized protein involved in type VI secretion and phage assembly